MLRVKEEMIRLSYPKRPKLNWETTLWAPKSRYRHSRHFKEDPLLFKDQSWQASLIIIDC